MYVMLLATVVLAVGCSAPVRSGVYTLASMSLGPDDLGDEFVLVKKGATGFGSTPIIIFPWGFPRDYDVMEKILEENGGDLLTNVTISSKTTLFIAFGSYQLDVVCDVWRKAGVGDMGSVPPDQLKRLDELGDVAYSRIALTPAIEIGGTHD